MKKISFRIFLFEIIFFLAGAAVDVLGILIQLIWKKKRGYNHSFFFGGTIYEYNYLFYILGLAVFLVFVYFFYKKVFRDLIARIKETGTFFRIFYSFVAIVNSVMIFIGNLYALLLLIGIGYDIRPTFLATLTFLGWPVILLIITMGSFILYLARKSDGKDELQAK